MQKIGWISARNRMFDVAYIHQCSIGGTLLGKLALGAQNYNHPINYLATSFGKYLAPKIFLSKKESGHSDAAVEPWKQMRFVEHRGFSFFASTLKITEQGMMVRKRKKGKKRTCQIMAEDHCDSQVLISRPVLYDWDFFTRNLEKNWTHFDNHVVATNHWT